jgi:hypothetical protein
MLLCVLCALWRETQVFVQLLSVWVCGKKVFDKQLTYYDRSNFLRGKIDLPAQPPAGGASAYLNSRTRPYSLPYRYKTIWNRWYPLHFHKIA